MTRPAAPTKRTALRRLATVFAATALVATACQRSGSSGPPVVVGALYPLSGSQGSGGVDEYHGVLLAADMANGLGGVGGRSIQVRAIDVPGSDAVPAAIDTLAAQGIRFVLGSYGSTISEPAAARASSRGRLFWETGAVGDMVNAEQGRLVFRVPPTGVVLGRSAVQFIAGQLAPLLHRRAGTLRFAVANVDDAYGRSVARGAVTAVHHMGLPFAGQFPYDPSHLDAPALVRRIAAARPSVLFVSAYMDDGIAVRREVVREGLKLVASIGTSSSYCMPEFGQELGADALGLFASDKPDGYALNEEALLPAARATLDEARAVFRARYHQEMSAAALAGFAAGWALFRFVMPQASALTPDGVAQAAQRVELPEGSLPNGSGLEFGPPNTPDAGANLRALSVIWEWVALGVRKVVWPPEFSTTAIELLPIAP